jgi:hypothetical protein
MITVALDESHLPSNVEKALGVGNRSVPKSLKQQELNKLKEVIRLRHIHVIY